jgi:dinuclear metal center YbgI/SA1388 family protein
MPRLHELTAFLKSFAPTALAEKWDNVGLLLGDSQREVQRVLTCLTLTSDVAREAIAERVELVVTHHPVLFKPIQRVTADDPSGRMLLDLLAARMAVYSPHTGYDSAAGGINQQLAEMFELRDVVPLRVRPPQPSATCKIVCFVPESRADAVRQALSEAGAGVIGEYSQCSFNLAGTGTFRGSKKSNPTIGKAGQLESVAEIRVEMDCPTSRLGDAVSRLRVVHPYEEPAFDIYPLIDEPDGQGTGRRGSLAANVTLADFIANVKLRLRVPQLKFVGDTTSRVRRVAVACGAGGEFVSDAIRNHCDVLLTGEARFHSCLEAQENGLALVLPGHYATERPAMEKLAEVLSAAFPDLTVWPSRVECDPVRNG